MSTIRRVKQIYSAVPDVRCKGLCAASCGAVPQLALFPAEKPLVEAASNHTPLYFSAVSNVDGSCVLLENGRCSIYSDRPLVCRLWGAVPEMRCPWGCEPTLSSDDGHRLCAEMKALK